MYALVETCRFVLNGIRPMNHETLDIKLNLQWLLGCHIRSLCAVAGLICCGIVRSFADTDLLVCMVVVMGATISFSAVFVVIACISSN